MYKMRALVTGLLLLACGSIPAEATIYNICTYITNYRLIDHTTIGGDVYCEGAGTTTILWVDTDPYVPIEITAGLGDQFDDYCTPNATDYPGQVYFNDCCYDLSGLGYFCGRHSCEWAMWCVANNASWVFPYYTALSSYGPTVGIDRFDPRTSPLGTRETNYFY